MLLVSELPAILTERDIGEKQKIKLAQDLILKHLEVHYTTMQDMYSNHFCIILIYTVILFKDRR